jgi:hypothetical protein
MSDNTEPSVQRVGESPSPQRNFFDRVGDFFERMIIGIFVFIFVKIPHKILKAIFNLERLKKLLRYLYSIMRAVVLCAIWISLVLLGWFLFLKEQFFKFWSRVWDLLGNGLIKLVEFIDGYMAWIWMILALCGSVYGLTYIVLKRRRRRAKGVHAQDNAEETRSANASGEQPTPPNAGDVPGNGAVPPNADDSVKQQD